MAPALGWVNHGERTVWTSDWWELTVADVSSPDGRRADHDVVRSRTDEVACLVTDDADQVLLVLHHRFVTGRWGWELPTTPMFDGEDVLSTATRGVVTECGWAVDQAQLVWSMARCPARTDLVAHLVVARAGEQVGRPHDGLVQAAWFGRSELHRVLAGSVQDVFTAAALVWWLSWADDGRPATHKEATR